MGVNAAEHFMNQAPFLSTFPILAITEIFIPWAFWDSIDPLIFFLGTPLFDIDNIYSQSFFFFQVRR